MTELHQHIDIGDRDLVWFDAEEAPRQVSDGVATLLNDPDSLTQHLIDISDEGFRVQLVAEDWQVIKSQALRAQFGPLARNHTFWSRKSLLFSDNEPVVLAHSLLPAHAFASRLGAVITLGEKPLGAYLFNQPDLRRASFQFARSGAGHWGRRSTFYVHKKPIMVAEFFLPGDKVDRLIRKLSATSLGGVSNF